MHYFNKPQFLSLDSIPQEIKEKQKQKFLIQIQEKSPEKNPEIIKKISINLQKARNFQPSFFCLLSALKN